MPTFVDLFRAGDDREAERLASGVLGMALAIMAVVSIVGVVFAEPIARILSSSAPNAQIESQQIALSAFFLRFFVPQVLLYAVGTVATAVLFAKRRFVIVAVAPIANAIILVATMAIFHAMHGPHPGLDLTTDEKLVLAIGGTLGVVGFVAVPTIALLRSGFRLRATLGAVDRKLRRLLFLSAWVASATRRRGAPRCRTGDGQPGRRRCGRVPVLLRRVPRAVRDPGAADPHHDPARADPRRREPRHARVRGPAAVGSRRHVAPPAADRAASWSLALPAMHVLAVGNSRHEADLFAAVLASLGVGLFTYGTFLFFAARCTRSATAAPRRSSPG